MQERKQLKSPQLGKLKSFYNKFKTYCLRVIKFLMSKTWKKTPSLNIVKIFHFTNLI